MAKKKDGNGSEEMKEGGNTNKFRQQPCVPVSVNVVACVGSLYSTSPTLHAQFVARFAAVVVRFTLI